MLLTNEAGQQTWVAAKHFNQFVVFSAYGSSEQLVRESTRTWAPASAEAAIPFAALGAFSDEPALAPAGHGTRIVHGYLPLVDGNRVLEPYDGGILVPSLDAAGNPLVPVRGANQTGQLSAAHLSTAGYHWDAANGWYARAVPLRSGALIFEHEPVVVDPATVVPGQVLLHVGAQRHWISADEAWNLGLVRPSGVRVTSELRSDGAVVSFGEQPVVVDPSTARPGQVLLHAGELQHWVTADEAARAGLRRPRRLAGAVFGARGPVLEDLAHFPDWPAVQQLREQVAVPGAIASMVRFVVADGGNVATVPGHVISARGNRVDATGNVVHDATGDVSRDYYGNDVRDAAGNILQDNANTVVVSNANVIGLDILLTVAGEPRWVRVDRATALPVPQSDSAPVWPLLLLEAHAAVQAHEQGRAAPATTPSTPRWYTGLEQRRTPILLGQNVSWQLANDTSTAEFQNGRSTVERWGRATVSFTEFVEFNAETAAAARSVWGAAGPPAGPRSDRSRTADGSTPYPAENRAAQHDSAEEQVKSETASDNVRIGTTFDSTRRANDCGPLALRRLIDLTGSTVVRLPADPVGDAGMSRLELEAAAGARLHRFADHNGIAVQLLGIGEGATALVVDTYHGPADTNGVGAHAYLLRVSDGAVVVIDPSTNRRYGFPPVTPADLTATHAVVYTAHGVPVRVTAADERRALHDLAADDRSQRDGGREHSGAAAGLTVGPESRTAETTQIGMIPAQSVPPDWLPVPSAVDPLCTALARTFNLVDSSTLRAALAHQLERNFRDYRGLFITEQQRASVAREKALRAKYDTTLSTNPAEIPHNWEHEERTRREFDQDLAQRVHHRLFQAIANLRHAGSGFESIHEDLGGLTKRELLTLAVDHFSANVVLHEPNGSVIRSFKSVFGPIMRLRQSLNGPYEIGLNADGSLWAEVAPIEPAAAPIPGAIPRHEIPARLDRVLASRQIPLLDGSVVGAHYTGETRPMRTLTTLDLAGSNAIDYLRTLGLTESDVLDRLQVLTLADSDAIEVLWMLNQPDTTVIEVLNRLGWAGSTMLNVLWTLNQAVPKVRDYLRILGLADSAVLDHLRALGMADSDVLEVLRILNQAEPNATAYLVEHGLAETDAVSLQISLGLAEWNVLSVLNYHGLAESTVRDALSTLEPAGSTVIDRSRLEIETRTVNTPAHYMTRAEREQHRLFVGPDGRLYQALDGAPFHTPGARFVMDEFGNLYSGRTSAVRYHSSFLGGRTVTAAGYLVVNDGRLVVMTDHSGHYEPAPQMNDYALDLLRRQGLVPADNFLRRGMDDTTRTGLWGPVRERVGELERQRAETTRLQWWLLAHASALDSLERSAATDQVRAYVQAERAVVARKQAEIDAWSRILATGRVLPSHRVSVLAHPDPFDLNDRIVPPGFPAEVGVGTLATWWHEHGNQWWNSLHFRDLSPEFRHRLVIDFSGLRNSAEIPLDVRNTLNRAYMEAELRVSAGSAAPREQYAKAAMFHLAERELESRLDAAGTGTAVAPVYLLKFEPDTFEPPLYGSRANDGSWQYTVPIPRIGALSQVEQAQSSLEQSSSETVDSRVQALRQLRDDLVGPVRADLPAEVQLLNTFQRLTDLLRDSQIADGSTAVNVAHVDDMLTTFHGDSRVVTNDHRLLLLDTLDELETRGVALSAANVRVTYLTFLDQIIGAVHGRGVTVSVLREELERLSASGPLAPARLLIGRLEQAGLLWLHDEMAQLAQYSGAAAEIAVHEVPKELNFVWFGGALSAFALANVKEWVRSAAGSDWQLTLWTQRGYDQVRTQLLADPELADVMDDTLHVADHLADFVGAVGGQELAAAFELTLQTGAFNLSSDIARYAVLHDRGGVYADVDLAPGPVDLADLGPMYMHEDDLPMFGPLIRDHQAVNHASYQGLPPSERIQRAVDDRYDWGWFGNHFIVAAPRSRYLADLITAIPEKILSNYHEEDWTAIVADRPKLAALLRWLNYYEISHGGLTPLEGKYRSMLDTLHGKGFDAVPEVISQLREMATMRGHDPALVQDAAFISGPLRIRALGNAEEINHGTVANYLGRVFGVGPLMQPDYRAVLDQKMVAAFRQVRWLTEESESQLPIAPAQPVNVVSASAPPQIAVHSVPFVSNSQSVPPDWLAVPGARDPLCTALARTFNVGDSRALRAVLAGQLLEGFGHYRQAFVPEQLKLDRAREDARQQNYDAALSADPVTIPHTRLWEEGLRRSFDDWFWREVDDHLQHTIASLWDFGIDFDAYFELGGGLTKQEFLTLAADHFHANLVLHEANGSVISSSDNPLRPTVQLRQSPSDHYEIGINVDGSLWAAVRPIAPTAAPIPGAVAPGQILPPFDRVLASRQVPLLDGAVLGRNYTGETRPLRFLTTLDLAESKVGDFLASLGLTELNAIEFLTALGADSGVIDLLRRQELAESTMIHAMTQLGWADRTVANVLARWQVDESTVIERSKLEIEPFLFTTPTHYMTPAEREQHRLFIGPGGRLYQARDGAPFHAPWGSKFVMDEFGNLYSGTSSAVTFHSSFLGGRTVTAAGYLVVRNGRLTVLTDHSGHYRPTPQMNDYALDLLRSRGLEPARSFKRRGFDPTHSGLNGPVRERVGEVERQRAEVDRRQFWVTARRRAVRERLPRAATEQMRQQLRSDGLRLEAQERDLGKWRESLAAGQVRPSHKLDIWAHPDPVDENDRIVPPRFPAEIEETGTAPLLPDQAQKLADWWNEHGRQWWSSLNFSALSPEYQRRLVSDFPRLRNSAEIPPAVRNALNRAGLEAAARTVVAEPASSLGQYAEAAMLELVDAELTARLEAVRKGTTTAPVYLLTFDPNESTAPAIHVEATPLANEAQLRYLYDHSLAEVAVPPTGFCLYRAVLETVSGLPEQLNSVARLVAAVVHRLADPNLRAQYRDWIVGDADAYVELLRTPDGWASDLAELVPRVLGDVLAAHGIALRVVTETLHIESYGAVENGTAREATLLRVGGAHFNGTSRFLARRVQPPGSLPMGDDESLSWDTPDPIAQFQLGRRSSVRSVESVRSVRSVESVESVDSVRSVDSVESVRSVYSQPEAPDIFDEMTGEELPSLFPDTVAPAAERAAFERAAVRAPSGSELIPPDTLVPAMPSTQAEVLGSDTGLLVKDARWRLRYVGLSDSLRVLDQLVDHEVAVLLPDGSSTEIDKVLVEAAFREEKQTDGSVVLRPTGTGVFFVDAAGAAKNLIGPTFPVRATMDDGMLLYVEGGGAATGAGWLGVGEPDKLDVRQLTATGPLFGSSGVPMPDDVRQGQLGTCYLMANLIGLAATKPSLLQDMIKPMKGGPGQRLFDVRFFDPVANSWVWVRVDDTFYANAAGQMLYAVHDPAQPLWPAVIEKAWALFRNPAAGYQGINGGWHSGDTVEMLRPPRMPGGAGRSQPTRAVDALLFEHPFHVDQDTLADVVGSQGFARMVLSWESRHLAAPRRAVEYTNGRFGVFLAKAVLDAFEGVHKVLSDPSQPVPEDLDTMDRAGLAARLGGAGVVDAVLEARKRWQTRDNASDTAAFLVYLSERWTASRDALQQQLDSWESNATLPDSVLPGGQAKPPVLAVWLAQRIERLIARGDTVTLITKVQLASANQPTTRLAPNHAYSVSRVERAGGSRESPTAVMVVNPHDGSEQRIPLNELNQFNSIASAGSGTLSAFGTPVAPSSAVAGTRPSARDLFGRPGSSRQPDLPSALVPGQATDVPAQPVAGQQARPERRRTRDVVGDFVSGLSRTLRRRRRSVSPSATRPAGWWRRHSRWTRGFLRRFGGNPAPRVESPVITENRTATTVYAEHRPVTVIDERYVAPVDESVVGPVPEVDEPIVASADESSVASVTAADEPVVASVPGADQSVVLPETSHPVLVGTGEPVPPPSTIGAGLVVAPLPGAAHFHRLSEEVRASHRIVVGPDGLLYRAQDGSLFDTTSGARMGAVDVDTQGRDQNPAIRRAPMVLDIFGNIYAIAEAQQVDPRITHASLLNGGRAAAAAEIEVRNGVLSVVVDQGGEYVTAAGLTDGALGYLLNGSNPIVLPPDFRFLAADSTEDPAPVDTRSMVSAGNEVPAAPVTAEGIALASGPIALAADVALSDDRTVASISDTRAPTLDVEILALDSVLPNASHDALSDYQIEQRRLVVGSDHRLHRASDGSLFDTGTHRAILVMDRAGNLYAERRIDDPDRLVTHAALLGGGPATFAMEIEARDGIISLLADRGGEYPITSEMNDSGLAQLVGATGLELAVDIRLVAFDAVNDREVDRTVDSLGARFQRATPDLRTHSDARITPPPGEYLIHADAPAMRRRHGQDDWMWVTGVQGSGWVRADTLREHGYRWQRSTGRLLRVTEIDGIDASGGPRRIELVDTDRFYIDADPVVAEDGTALLRLHHDADELLVTDDAANQLGLVRPTELSGVLWTQFGPEVEDLDHLPNTRWVAELRNQVANSPDDIMRRLHENAHGSIDVDLRAGAHPQWMRLSRSTDLPWPPGGRAPIWPAILLASRAVGDAEIATRSAALDPPGELPAADSFARWPVATPSTNPVDDDPANWSSPESRSGASSSRTSVRSQLLSETESVPVSDSRIPEFDDAVPSETSDGQPDSLQHDEAEFSDNGGSAVASSDGSNGFDHSLPYGPIPLASFVSSMRDDPLSILPWRIRLPEIPLYTDRGELILPAEDGIFDFDNLRWNRYSDRDGTRYRIFGADDSGWVWEHDLLDAGFLQGADGHNFRRGVLVPGIDDDVIVFDNETFEFDPTRRPPEGSEGLVALRLSDQWEWVHEDAAAAALGVSPPTPLPGPLWAESGPQVADLAGFVPGPLYDQLRLLAEDHPQFLRDMFRENNDGTVDVRMLVEERARWIRLDRSFPWDTDRPAADPIWPLLLNMAAAQADMHTEAAVAARPRGPQRADWTGESREVNDVEQFEIRVDNPNQPTIWLSWSELENRGLFLPPVEPLPEHSQVAQDRLGESGPPLHSGLLPAGPLHLTALTVANGEAIVRSQAGQRITLPAPQLVTDRGMPIRPFQDGSLSRLYDDDHRPGNTDQWIWIAGSNGHGWVDASLLAQAGFAPVADSSAYLRRPVTIAAADGTVTLRDGETVEITAGPGAQVRLQRVDGETITVDRTVIAELGLRFPRTLDGRLWPQSGPHVGHLRAFDLMPEEVDPRAIAQLRELVALDPDFIRIMVREAPDEPGAVDVRLVVDGRPRWVQVSRTGNWHGRLSDDHALWPHMILAAQARAAAHHARLAAELRVDHGAPTGAPITWTGGQRPNEDSGIEEFAVLFPGQRRPVWMSITWLEANNVQLRLPDPPPPPFPGEHESIQSSGSSAVAETNSVRLRGAGDGESITVAKVFISDAEAEHYAEVLLGPVRDKLRDEHPAEYDAIRNYANYDGVVHFMRADDPEQLFRTLRDDYERDYTISFKDGIMADLPSADEIHALRAELPAGPQADVYDHLLGSGDPAALRIRLREFERNSMSYQKLSADMGAMTDGRAHVTYEQIATYIDTFVTGLHRQALPEPVRVVRGVGTIAHLRGTNGNPVSPADLSNLIGSIQVEPAAMSTSIGVAAPNMYRSLRYQLELELPAGTPGIWIGAASTEAGDREYLLPPGMRYVITEVVENPRTVLPESGDRYHSRVKWLIKAQLLPVRAEIAGVRAPGADGVWESQPGTGNCLWEALARAVGVGVADRNAHRDFRDGVVRVMLARLDASIGGSKTSEPVVERRAQFAQQLTELLEEGTWNNDAADLLLPSAAAALALNLDVYHSDGGVTHLHFGSPQQQLNTFMLNRADGGAHYWVAVHGRGGSVVDTVDFEHVPGDLAGWIERSMRGGADVAADAEDALLLGEDLVNLLVGPATEAAAFTAAVLPAAGSPESSAVHSPTGSADAPPLELEITMPAASIELPTRILMVRDANRKLRAITGSSILTLAGRRMDGELPIRRLKNSRNVVIDIPEAVAREAFEHVPDRAGWRPRTTGLVCVDENNQFVRLDGPNVAARINTLEQGMVDLLLPAGEWLTVDATDVFDVEIGRATGPLFNGLPRPDDVTQGMVGDCYLLSNLIGLAARNPDLIVDMIRETEEIREGTAAPVRTFSVRFYEAAENRWVWVKVDDNFYRKSAGGMLYAAQEELGPLWPAVIEKAWAVFRGAAQGYHGIDGGMPGNAAGQLRPPQMPGFAGRVQPTRSVDLSLGSVFQMDLDLLTRLTEGIPEQAGEDPGVYPSGFARMVADWLGSTASVSADQVAARLSTSASSVSTAVIVESNMAPQDLLNMERADLVQAIDEDYGNTVTFGEMVAAIQAIENAGTEDTPDDPVEFENFLVAQWQIPANRLIEQLAAWEANAALADVRLAIVLADHIESLLRRGDTVNLATKNEDQADAGNPLNLVSEHSYAVIRVVRADAENETPAAPTEVVVRDPNSGEISVPLNHLNLFGRIGSSGPGTLFFHGNKRENAGTGSAPDTVDDSDELHDYDYDLPDESDESAYEVRATPTAGAGPVTSAGPPPIPRATRPDVSATSMSVVDDGGEGSSLSLPEGWEYLREQFVAADTGSVTERRAVFTGTDIRVPERRTAAERLSFDGVRPVDGKPMEPDEDYEPISIADREKFRIVVGPDGRLYSADGAIFDTVWAAEQGSGSTRDFAALQSDPHVPERRATMVMDVYGNMYALTKEQQRRYGRSQDVTHASLLGGAPAAAAAEIEVRAGVLRVLVDWGGEYDYADAPTDIDLTDLNAAALRYLRAQPIGLRVDADLEHLSYEEATVAFAPAPVPVVDAARARERVPAAAMPISEGKTVTFVAAGRTVTLAGGTTVAVRVDEADPARVSVREPGDGNVWHQVDRKLLVDAGVRVPHVQRVSGPLFGLDDMPRASDVKQGEVGTCYLLADLIGLAAQHPEWVRQMIRFRADGDLEVRFIEQDDGRAISATGDPASIDPIRREVWVPVDRRFYAYEGKIAYAAHADGQPLWPAVIEKAWALYRGGNKGYAGISGLMYPGDTARSLWPVDSPGAAGRTLAIRAVDDSVFAHPLMLGPDDLAQLMGGNHAAAHELLDLVREWHDNLENWGDPSKRDVARAEYDRIAKLGLPPGDTGPTFAQWRKTRDPRTATGFRTFLKDTLGAERCQQLEPQLDLLHAEMTRWDSVAPLVDSVLTRWVADRIANMLRRGDMVIMTTRRLPGGASVHPDTGLSHGHAYFVADVVAEETTGRVTGMRLIDSNSWQPGHPFPDGVTVSLRHLNQFNMLSSMGPGARSAYGSDKIAPPWEFATEDPVQQSPSATQAAAGPQFSSARDGSPEQAPPDSHHSTVDFFDPTAFGR
ncbi:hypothetical protein NN4_12460 [Nocardia ninae NBRC 108245]|uniref:Calpain catalytic domain-containing protein n=1 Tax=Nocardia ninae NBRC 108245 TaxID=1210091 RepID=A0A511M931_9NOCA|nr:hypothetical protein NN4_12460 [Nocardia ninae NBRC 108245]